MTEPSDAAVRLVHKLRTYGRNTEFAVPDKIAASAIDSLCTERVAAERERPINDRMRRAGAEWIAAAYRAQDRVDPEVLAQNVYVAMRDTDRPAPESAAPTVDLARHRCSTPSQEDTGSVSGDRWRKKPVVIEAIQWTGGNREEVFAWLRPRERCEVYYVGEVAETGPRLAVETLEGKTFANPGHWIIRGVKGELYPCAADIFAATYDAAEPPKDVSGPGSASNTESSPTQTVAAPELTAGDVELAHEMVTDWQNAVSPEGWDELHKLIATALYDHAYAARAELLAEITEPSMAVWLAGAMSQCGYSATVVLRAIADKLGGTKE